MKKNIRLADLLHDLSSNSEGISKVEQANELIKAIENYQNTTLHELSEGHVTSSNIRELLRITRRIHDLRNVQFQDEEIPRVLLDVFRCNLDVLEKLNPTMREELERDLVNKAMEEGSAQEKYEAMLHHKANQLVKEFEKEETERLERLADDDVKAVALGLPLQNIHRDFRNPDEKLRDIIISIREDQLQKEKKRLEDLSLFKDSKSLREYKERKRQKLDEILNAVSDSVVRNYPNEKLISQGYKVKNEDD